MTATTPSIPLIRGGFKIIPPLYDEKGNNRYSTENSPFTEKSVANVGEKGIN